MARAKPTRKTTIPSFSQIDKMSYSQVRKTYSELRTIFNKRIERAVKAGMGAARAYDVGVFKSFPVLALRFTAEGEQGITNEDKRLALQYDIKELVNLMTGGGGAAPLSLAQAREFAKAREEQIVDSLHEAGYDRISKSTLKGFGRFMDQMRAQYGRKLPNSEEMAEFFNSLKYNTKRRSTQFIVDLWEDFKNNGYEPDNGNIDLFST